MKLRFENFVGVDGEHRWRAVAANGAIIASASEGYLRRGDAKSALSLFIDAIERGDYSIIFAPDRR